MGKSQRLQQKKKELAEKNKKPLFNLTITVMDDNDIEVNGPIDDPILVMDLFAAAMRVVCDYNRSPEKLNADIEKGRKEKESSRIIDISGSPANAEPKKIIV